MFEFQTAISELTGLPVSNASVYEGPSAVAAAGYLAQARDQAHEARHLARPAPALARRAAPPTPPAIGMEVVEVPLTDEGATDLEALAAAVDDDTAAVFLQQPNFLGTVEELGPLAEAAKRTGALFVVRRRPAAARHPRAARRAAASTSASARARRSATGSTSAARRSASSPREERFIRKMPGRIAGETRDVDGKRGFVLTLQTREQHIRREKATHNICTSQALNALAGVIYLSWLGKRGPRRAGRADAAAHPLRARGARRSSRSTRVPWCASSPCACRTSTRSFERARAEGINPGYRLGARLPRVRGRPAGGHHRAAHAGADRPPGRAWPPAAASRWPRHDRRRARPAGRRGHAHDLRALARGPARLRGARARRARGADRGAAARLCPPRATRRAARGLRARDRAPLQRALEEELRPRHRLLPARARAR